MQLTPKLRQWNSGRCGLGTGQAPYCANNYWFAVETLGVYVKVVAVSLHSAFCLLMLQLKA